MYLSKRTIKLEIFFDESDFFDEYYLSMNLLGMISRPQSYKKNNQNPNTCHC
jgi:hypothetical protein